MGLAGGEVTLLALALLAVVIGAVLMGAGLMLAKYSATGTMIRPASTVSTKVTAPHSRRSTDQFTSGEFYLDRKIDRGRV